MSATKRLPYGRVSSLVKKAQAAGCTTAREISEHSGLSIAQANNALMRLRRDAGKLPRAERAPLPSFTQEEAEGLRRLLGQQERQAEVSALRTGQTVLARVDAGLLETARQHAKRHNQQLSQLVSNALESYLSAVTTKAGG